MKQIETPILFLIFNRPDTTKRVFSVIREIKPKQLFIASDGPRVDKPDDIEKCKETREIVSKIDWPCEVKTLFREKNLGCKIAVSSAIDWFFENVEEGIILEDDCLPDPSFFPYCEELLNKYRDNEKIMMISGNNYLPKIKIKESYFFSQYFSIWGWATWKRAWKKYDINIKSWERPSNKKKLDKIYQPKYMFKYMSSIFDKVYSDKINTWDFQWFYTCLINNGLCIVPKVNLISNIGINGTHAKSNSYGKNQNLQIFNIYNNPKLEHPTTIYQNTNYDNIFYKKNFKKNFFKKLKSQIVYIIALINNILLKNNYSKKIKNKLLHFYKYLFNKNICINVNHSNHSKNCLFLYITKPFKTGNENNQHQNNWQVKEIAKILNEFGYNVDVVDFNNKQVRLNKFYDMLIDLHPIQSNIYNDKLMNNCIKISYITGNNPAFSNREEKKRLNDIYKRKDFKIQPRRQVELFDQKYFKSFDSMFFIGNNFTLETYRGYAPKKTFQIPNTGYTFLNKTNSKERSSKNFLFLAGGGSVLKGLDLLLEIFSNNKDLHLYVCSNFAKETDFCELYKKELFETSNIHPVGFVNINSFEFMNIVSKCSYIISPSCSDVMTGSVLTGMSAGLIPIVSKESGFDETEVYLLKDCKLDTISNTIADFASKPKDWINNESQRFINITNEKFCRKNFSDSINKALTATIDAKQHKKIKHNSYLRKNN